MSTRAKKLYKQACRSREGGWIEIPYKSAEHYQNASRSREGAWIEILTVSNEE